MSHHSDNKRPEWLIAKLNLTKTMKMLTMSLGGEGYLNFMGNEFSHPEWIEFPEPFNNYSYEKCRRFWWLVNEGDLVYKKLMKFDEKLMKFFQKYSKLTDYVGVLDPGRDDVAYYMKGDGIRYLVNMTEGCLYFHMDIPEDVPKDKEVQVEVLWDSAERDCGPILEFAGNQKLYKLDNGKIEVLLHGFSFLVFRFVVAA